MSDSVTGAHGQLVLHARIMPASNATFFGAIDDVRVVYKPIAGERPLWDFPGACLARREVAAYLVSQQVGWDIVPRTWLGDGPHGLGMVQVWCESDPSVEAVTLVPEGEVPSGWRRVFDGIDERDRPVSLIHEDTQALRRMAIYDAIINNADRKGGHVLAMPDGHRYGVDHGIAFHHEPKLRTVLWGWAGSTLDDDERDVIEELLDALDADLGTALLELLDVPEVDALRDRCRALLRNGVLPHPSGEWPAIPWPPF